MLWGFVLLVVFPAAFVVLLITVLGIPIAFILLALYFILLYVSRVFVGLALGRWLFSRTGRPQTSLYLSLLVGLLIIWIIGAIPFIGGLVKFAVILLGLGALIVERYTRLRTRRTEAAE